MRSGGWRALAAAWMLAASAVALFCLELRYRWRGPTAALGVDDWGSVAADFVAVGACLLRARRCRGRRRLSWILMTAACLTWAAGDGIWAWYELVVRRLAPFPSIADVSYLATPVLAMAALAARPVDGHMLGRLRTAIDGALCAASLATLSWVTVLGAVYKAREDSTTAFAIALAYLVTDVALAAAHDRPVATSDELAPLSRWSSVLPYAFAGVAVAAVTVTRRATGRTTRPWSA